jgi:Ca2+-binding RTX toxin-like protein
MEAAGMGYAWARTLAAAIAIAVVAAIPAQAANYPNGGSDFAASAQGWVDSGESCSNATLCSTSAHHDPSVGNPAGSLAVQMNVIANLGGSFTGTGTWTSPVFTVPAGGAVTGATFQYDRQLTAGGLVTLTLEGDVRVELVDLAGGAPTVVLDETLISSNSTFSTRGVGVPASAVTAGHSYQLRILSSITAAVSLGVAALDTTRFDNVVLAVDQAADNGNGGDGGGGGGGTGPVVKSFRTDSQITALFARYNENAEFGRGPGGSLVAREHCTIIGTSRADRITGTSGNDVICGLGGNDVIDGAGGIDIIDGANGKDRLGGGPAKDKLIGLRGNDRLNGNAGDDHVGGGASRDRVAGAAGADRIGGGSGRDALVGGAGRDQLSARDRTRDSVDGGAGRDQASVDRLSRRGKPGRAALRRVDRVRRVERMS